MTSTEARSKVKSRVGVSSVTTFDGMIDDFILSAVMRLYPSASLEVDAQEITNFTVDKYGECRIDLTTLTAPIKVARLVEAYNGYTWDHIDDTLHHGKYLRLRGIRSDHTKLRLFGLNNFSAITEVYDHLTQAVIWFAVSEFYDQLAANDSDYNVYTQAAGARAVDNMRDQSAYFETKASTYLEEQRQAYGL